MKLSLRWRLMFTYLGILSIVFLAISLFLNASLKDHFTQRMEERLSRDAALALEYLEKTYPKPWSFENIDAWTDEVGAALGMRVTVVDSTGKVLGDSELEGEALRDVENHANRPEIRAAVAQGVGKSVRYSTTVRTDMMYVALRVGDPQHPRGVVRVSFPLTEITHTFARIRSLLLVGWMIGFSLTFVFGLVASRYIIQPLREMTERAQAMARGDFSRKISTRARDEVGLLASTLNQMAAQLEATISEITTKRSELEAILNAMSEGVMVTDARSRILLTNASLQQMLGLSEDGVGKTPLELIRHAELQKLIRQVLQENRLVRGEITLRGWVGGGEERIVAVNGVPLALDGGGQGVVAVFHDITELRRLEQVRKDFVANVSHELRTPLAVIRGYAETLLEGALRDRERARNFVEVIRKHVARMAQLVSDLLQLSKLESEEYAAPLQPIRLQQFLPPLLAGLREAMERKALSFTWTIPEDLPEVRADEEGLEQVFINLLDNAVKYTPEGGSITVKASVSGDEVLVEVRDTGIGISAKDLPRIFERFYRVDKARSRELGGTGLGLSIVKHTIQNYGGRIWVESEVGRGSTFYFTLPKA